MIKENRFIYIDILPGAPGGRRSRSGGEVYRPRNYEKTSSSKLEKLERELSQQESQKVLEKLNETEELKCPKCNSKAVSEDDTDKNFYKFKCFDCGFEWKFSKTQRK